MAEQTRTCTGCQQVLMRESFHRDKSAKHGRRSKCRECVAEYSRANRAHHTERVRSWRAANPERERENRRKYHEKNRDRLIEQRRQHRAANPHVDWESDYRKRCRATGQIPVVVSFTREELVEFWGNGEHCIWCDGPFEEIDHLYPIALGGVHSIATVVPSCSGCNRAGGQHAAQFLRQMTEDERHLQVIIGATRARLAPLV